jgi:hypothetical protein
VTPSSTIPHLTYIYSYVFFPPSRHILIVQNSRQIYMYFEGNIWSNSSWTLPSNSLNVWKFDFHWTFVWNMLNVWKYGHLSENLSFIGYLCKICLMYKNKAIWVKIWLSLVIYVKHAKCVKIWPFDVLCSASEVLCSVSNEHYTKSGNCSDSDGRKGRRALSRRVSHLKKNETRFK